MSSDSELLRPHLPKLNRLVILVPPQFTSSAFFCDQLKKESSWSAPQNGPLNRSWISGVSCRRQRNDPRHQLARNSPQSEGSAVIRQAISCDICGTEKRQTNHWFVAYEQAGELRVSGWNSRHRFRADSKHLCGQTCLHKLVDEFMAKSIAVRAQNAADDSETEPRTATLPIDASLTSRAAYPEPESSARLISPPAPLQCPHPEPVTSAPHPQPKEHASAPDEPLRYSSRTWRAEAWERERARTLRAVGKYSEGTTRRHSST